VTSQHAARPGEAADAENEGIQLLEIPEPGEVEFDRGWRSAPPAIRVSEQPPDAARQRGLQCWLPAAPGLRGQSINGESSLFDGGRDFLCATASAIRVLPFGRYMRRPSKFCSNLLTKIDDGLTGRGALIYGRFWVMPEGAPLRQYPVTRLPRVTALFVSSLV
jgi:hypothetical protein